MYTEKQSHEIGVKASAAEAGQYTMEPGVLAYYEVEDRATCRVRANGFSVLTKRFWTFFKVCEILNKDKSIKIFWHKEHDVPYAYKPGLWIGFDNLESIVNKVNYVKSMKLGGVIVW